MLCVNSLYIVCIVYYFVCMLYLYYVVYMLSLYVLYVCLLYAAFWYGGTALPNTRVLIINQSINHQSKYKQLLLHVYVPLNPFISHNLSH